MTAFHQNKTMHQQNQHINQFTLSISNNAFDEDLFLSKEYNNNSFYRKDSLDESYFHKIPIFSRQNSIHQNQLNNNQLQQQLPFDSQHYNVLMNNDFDADFMHLSSQNTANSGQPEMQRILDEESPQPQINNYDFNQLGQQPSWLAPQSDQADQSQQVNFFLQFQQQQ